MIFQPILQTISSFKFDEISDNRKQALQILIDYIQKKINENHSINLNFICTHNSRRSHLSQVWAQTAAAYYQIDDVNCYSGGTEATAVFLMVIKVLEQSGFQISNLSNGINPVYSIKLDENKVPIIGFSKTFDHPFNPKSEFAAIMTCSSADANCPLIPGTEKRIVVKYDDPKEFDNTPQKEIKYKERSTQIATEMFYAFSQIKCIK